MNLPFDYSRCFGTTAPLCMICRRREPGHPTYQSYISPELDASGCCPNFIEPPKTASGSHQEARSNEQGEST